MVAEYVNRAIIKINGVELTRQVKPYLEEICVDDKAHVPSMFTITFVDMDHDILGKTRAEIGARIEIKATPTDEMQPYPLLTGEITALEADYGVRGARAIIRGYDLSHRLHRGRHTETYVNSTDSDIARKIATRHGITAGTIESTSVTYEHVSQANMSDWDFIWARAQRIGFEVGVVDGKFNFQKPKPASGAPSPGTLRSTAADQLFVGAEIEEFHPRITAGSQVKAIKVRGWDHERKREIVATASAATVSSSLTGFSPLKAAGDVKTKHDFVSVSRPVTNLSDANSVAKAIAEQIGSSFAEADGVALGDPRIVAGKPISVAGVSNEFKGKWVISHARHVINADGYRIHFSASGQQERSLLGLTSFGTSAWSAPSQPRIYGLVVGIVTNNRDDKKLGRVKVRLPWLADASGPETYESFWARVVYFGAGKDRGAFFVPEVDDEVLIGFEHGDVNRPYVLGGLYSTVDKPNLGIDAKGSADDVVGNDVKRRGFTSRKGHAIVFIDDDSDKDGVVIRSSDGKHKIEIKAKSNELRITTSGKLFVTSQDDMALESKKNLSIKASMGLKVEAGTSTEMKAGTQFKVQGTQVEIKGSGPVQVNGTPIKLN